MTQPVPVNVSLDLHTIIYNYTHCSTGTNTLPNLECYRLKISGLSGCFRGSSVFRGKNLYEIVYRNSKTETLLGHFLIFAFLQGKY